jgi:hypothetical protein
MDFVNWENKASVRILFARSENEVRLRALHGVEILVG